MSESRPRTHYRPASGPKLARANSSWAGPSALAGAPAAQRRRPLSGTAGVPGSSGLSDNALSVRVVADVRKARGGRLPVLSCSPPTAHGEHPSTRRVLRHTVPCPETSTLLASAVEQRRRARPLVHAPAPTRPRRKPVTRRTQSPPVDSGRRAGLGRGPADDPLGVTVPGRGRACWSMRTWREPSWASPSQASARRPLPPTRRHESTSPCPPGVM